MRHRANLIVFWIVVLSSIALLLLVIVRPDLAPSWSGIGQTPQPEQGVEPAKRLWDWLQLLAIPLFLGIGAWWLGTSLWATGQDVVRQRFQSERDLEETRQYRAALQAYYDSIGDLLINGYLREAGNRQASVRNVAQARTLALFRSLDGKHKGEALQFLYDSGLIGRTRIVSTKYADLRQAQLRQAVLCQASLWQANLNEADLTGANLKQADLWLSSLRDARLVGANLRGAHLGEVDLGGADLRGADLTGASLRKAILDGADLTNARVTAEQLSRARSLTGLRLPNGATFDGDVTPARQS